MLKRTSQVVRGTSIEINIWEDFDLESPREFTETILKIDGCPRYLSVDEGDPSSCAETFPVYAYIHSGIALSLAPFGCMFDSGQVGMIGAESKEKAAQEIELFSEYLGAQGCGWTILVDGIEVDSCGGFYCIEDALNEAQEQVNYLIDKPLSDREKVDETMGQIAAQL